MSYLAAAVAIMLAIAGYTGYSMAEHPVEPVAVDCTWSMPAPVMLARNDLNVRQLPEAKK